MPSSVIRRYDYAADERRLRILFTSGETYDYFDVPPEVKAGLDEAGSRGRYFGQRIRDAYRFRRLVSSAR